jgi:hypothetical protein
MVMIVEQGTVPLLLEAGDKPPELKHARDAVQLCTVPLLYSPETFFLCFWYSFLLEAE